MTSPVKSDTCIGKINYLNCLPFYYQLEEKAAEANYYEAYPTKLNLAMRKGKVQAAPISSLEYLNHHEKYLLLPDLGIAARDFSGSVLLFSKEKLEGLNKAKIALTKQSLSSATLLRILLKFKFKFSNTFVSMNASPEKMLEQNDAALVIGNDALFFEPKEFLYKYDLSELWWDWTEKPFCFAVWAVRRDFAGEFPDTVARLHSQLCSNRNRNLADIEGLIRKAMGLSFMDKRFPKIYGYFFNLYYGMDERILEGLELFYRLAHRLGVSPRPQKPDFFTL